MGEPISPRISSRVLYLRNRRGKGVEENLGRGTFHKFEEVLEHSAPVRFSPLKQDI